MFWILMKEVWERNSLLIEGPQQYFCYSTIRKTTTVILFSKKKKKKDKAYYSLPCLYFANINGTCVQEYSFESVK